MCDPITLGTLAIGAAGTVANTIGKASAEKRQSAEIQKWEAYQKQQRAAEMQRQEGLRQKAQAAQQQGLADIAGENQAKLQDTEQARLEGEYLGGGPGDNESTAAPAVADQMLAGQHTGGEVFQTDMARHLADATASAKERIKALATLGSFGGSSGGLGTVNPINQARAGSGIDVANNFRRGSMSAYDAVGQVEPVQINYSNPIADIAQSFLGAGMGRVGQGIAGAPGVGSLSSIFKTAFKPATALPAVGPIPTPRPMF